MAGAAPLAHPPGRVTAPRAGTPDGSRREAGYRDVAALPGHGHAGAAPAWELVPAFPG